MIPLLLRARSSRLGPFHIQQDRGHVGAHVLARLLEKPENHVRGPSSLTGACSNRMKPQSEEKSTPGTKCFMHRPCLALALSGNIGTVRQAHEQKLHYRAASLTNRPIMTCCFNPTYPHVW